MPPRSVGEWTKDKLLVLERYLPGYLQATKRAIDRVYVDAFCGPGTNKVEETGEEIPGSPLIGLASQAQNGTKFTKYFFIDNNQQNIDELRSHVTRSGLESQCSLIRGDVNEVLPRVIGGLHKRAPTFVFLDTQGIEPHWSTIQAIADWRVEFLINFPLGMAINRNPDSRRTLEYFGTEECLPLLHLQGTTKVRGLSDFYKRRLTELGFVRTTEDDRLIKTQMNQALYYLIFVSKKIPASTIMNWVLRQPDASGQTRLQI